MRRTLIRVSLLLVILNVVGCGQQAVLWNCSFDEQSGHAVFTTEKFALEFESVRIDRTAGMKGGGSTGSLQVAGSGNSEITLTSLKQTLTNSYSNGVNTITLGKYTAFVKQNGRTVVIGDRSFELGDSKTTIVLHEDGTADKK